MVQIVHKAGGSHTERGCLTSYPCTVMTVVASSLLVLYITPLAWWHHTVMTAVARHSQCCTSLARATTIMIINLTTLQLPLLLWYEHQTLDSTTLVHTYFKLNTGCDRSRQHKFSKGLRSQASTSTQCAHMSQQNKALRVCHQKVWNSICNCMCAHKTYRCAHAEQPFEGCSNL